MGPKLTVTKKFSYRGQDELWSNSYHMTDFPVTPADWDAFVTGFAVIECNVYSSDSRVFSFLGYSDSSPHVPAIYSVLAADIGADVVGGLAMGTDQAWAGDQAGTIGWKTGTLGTTGKPIWLRKYFHDGFSPVDENTDAISVATASAYATFGAALLASPMGMTTVGGATPIVFSDAGGTPPVGPVRVDPWVTTRTLERRGKRP